MDSKGSDSVAWTVLCIIGMALLVAVLAGECIRGGPVLGGSVVAAVGGMMGAVGVIRRRPN